MAMTAATILTALVAPAAPAAAGEPNPDGSRTLEQTIEPARVPIERGGEATVGIENADGTSAIRRTHRQPVLRSGLGLWFNPPTP
ncbi:hypothetical protein ABT023_17955 [Micromonospora sp. NPDC002296]|uniref:hypothetical protein n=1 Tax=Micromonospora sp. NPDC002296 TaxID=3154271 RepID=UPI00331757CA